MGGASAGGGAGDGGGGGGGLAGTGSGGGGTYKAPSLRAGAMPGGTRVITDAERVQLKVSSLAPETTEDDLRSIFQPWGNLDPKFKIAKDSNGNSRGFCFLRYATHREAQAAIQNINGYRLHHMVLKVEFTEPREHHMGGGGGHRHLSGYGKNLADTRGATLL